MRRAGTWGDRVKYPDQEQYLPFMPPESLRSSTATRVRLAVRIAFGLALVAAVLWVGWQVGPPPEWIRWAGLAVPLTMWAWRERCKDKSERDR